jgi:hypothetical protein
VYPPVPTFPPLPKRIRGDRVREARSQHAPGDWQVWPEPEQPTSTIDDQQPDES